MKSKNFPSKEMNNPQYSILYLDNLECPNIFLHDIIFLHDLYRGESSVHVAVKFLTKQLISPKPQHVFLSALANNATLQVVSR